MVKDTTLGDPGLVHPAAARAEDTTVTTADTSPSHASYGLLCICNMSLQICLFNSEAGQVCAETQALASKSAVGNPVKEEELQRETKSLKDKVSLDLSYSAGTCSKVDAYS